MKDLRFARRWREYLSDLPRGSRIEWTLMSLVTALAAALNFWRLNAVGYGNEYYSAAVWSMAHSWKAFWFAGYDTGGFITVDKPPVGFWLEVASVKLFGFSGFSLLAPEALAGVLAVVVLWRVTRRVFGPSAGVLAALTLAITPVAVVTSRDNVLEPALVLTLLLAAWALLAAVERGSWGLLFLCGLLVGVAFNVKMLEAYLVVPAFALVWTVCAPGRVWARLARLGAASVAMVAVSLAWVVSVDVTPASQRPYVGSTTNNSELALAFGYNGLLRLMGSWRPRWFAHGSESVHAARHIAGIFHEPARGAAHSGGHVAHVFPPGVAGPLRLFQAPLGSQGSWLLLLALVGLALAALAAAGWLRTGEDGAQRESRARWLRGALLWGGWLGVCMLAFSFARFINSYYVALMAPAIGALAGAAAVQLWRAYCSASRLGYALPVVVAAAGIEQAALVQAAPSWGPSWAALTAAWSLLALALALWRLIGDWRSWRAARSGDRIAGPDATARRALAALALGLLLVTPFLWSASSLTQGNSGGWPVAGPEFAAGGDLTPRRQVDQKLVTYLEAHRGRATFLAATVDPYLASPLIMVTGQPVMDMGGFSGRDPALSQPALARAVARDDVRYFLVSSANVTDEQREALFAVDTGPTARRTVESQPEVHAAYTNSLTHWVSDHCAPVPPAQWSSAPDAHMRLGPWELYACV